MLTNNHPYHQNHHLTSADLPYHPIDSHQILQYRLSKLGLKPTELIGHYAIQKTIGEGTFSKVKLAVNLNNCQKVAIKMIGMQGIRDSERVKSSVLREVEILKVKKKSFFFLKKNF